ncbi:DUF3108 domain-containing protein [Corallincola platygyrae]|uniref:DUF3108 domain-containing protein n=1 Tax=Corallincola platygyrae TaxID=1193278 RepID=A0ABW4XUN4_9GAMM
MKTDCRQMVMPTTNTIRALISALFFATASCAVFASSKPTAEADIATTSEAPAPVRPYHAEYKVFRGGSEYGSGKRTLKQVEDNLWYLETETNISWLFLSDKRNEKSWFEVHPDRVTPIQYRQSREGTGPDFLSLVGFDHRLKKVKEFGDYDEFEAVYEDGILDGASYQFQMMRDIASGESDASYPLIMNGENKHYRYRVVGEEQLTTPMGDINTVKLERVRSSKKRQTFVWLAKDYGYVVARIWQAKSGSEQADLQISKFEWLAEGANPELKQELRLTAAPGGKE